MPAENLSDEKLNISGNSHILDVFKIYAAELTARHDRHERLVRLSRDVTTESKRVIFYMHSLKPEDYESGLPMAEKRLKALSDGPLKKAASELHTRSSLDIPVPRVLTPAVEELAEAFCLLQYLKTFSTTEMPLWSNLQSLVTSSQGENLEKTPSMVINPLDFMLGVLDFTGEIMRICINKSSTVDNSMCFTIKTVMQNLYMGFIGLRYHKDIHNKMSTFKQSLQKVEDTCYNLKLRSHQGEV